MNRIPRDKRSQIIRLLVEGSSIRLISRITGSSKNTIVKLLADVGSKCLDYQDEVLRNLPCRHLQCDEIWSFCYAKEKNAPEEKRGEFGYGDVWTWTALCGDTMLVPCWHIGRRTVIDAEMFINDLAARMTTRVQLTTDEHRACLEAVEGAFGGEVDYAMLVKLYGPSPEGRERRYSPAECTGTEKRIISGKPDSQHISTSFVKRQNLTTRMGMRRFTRLTNGFPKKIENLAHAVSLHYMYYNFARIHQSLRVTPAMAAGISSHIWEVDEIAALDD